MQKEKKQHDSMLLDEELYQLIGSVTEVPYSALLLEQPEFIFITGSIERLIGYSAAEIYADRQLWLNIIHPDDKERFLAAFARCKNEGAGFEIEYRIIHKDGSLRYVRDKGEPVFNDKGRITQVEGLIADISECKKTVERCIEGRVYDI